MNTIILKIEGMSCSACSLSLEKYLNKQAGICQANVNLVLAQAYIEYNDTLSIKDLEEFIKEAGFKSLGVYDGKEEQQNKKIESIKLTIFGILLVFILYISMGHMLNLPPIFFLNMAKYPITYTICLFILTTIFLIYGLNIIKSGIKNLLHKSPNMDTLVTIGVFSSYLYSIFHMILIILGNTKYVNHLYFESCATIIYFISVGRYIDSRSKEKTKEAIKELVQITPSTAFLKIKNNIKEVSIDSIKTNDILIAKPGMKIAVDGKIVEGTTHLDESFITGEAIPIKKTVNDKVVAGSINQDGYIEYKAEKIGKNSTISEIVRLVVEATNTKAPIAKIADKVCEYFVPSIMIIAVITFISYLILGFSFKDALVSFITVLVVACPCALGLATPLAIVISEGICAKKGILVKSSEILEKAHTVDTIIFDKTGTITYGNLKISKIFNYSNYQDQELITLAASVEKKSSHPISNAFNLYVADHKLKLKDTQDFKNIEGIGLKAKIDNLTIYIGNNKLLTKLNIRNSYQQDEDYLTKTGHSIVYVIGNKKVLGLIGVKDVIRNNAYTTILKLKTMGINMILLTGDNRETAHIIANSVGINEVIANVLPQEKTKIIKELMAKGNTTMMVGDGINDAPSLATADIGVGINSGTDIALNSADVILLHDNLEKIIDLIYISKKTITNIKQNLFWAFFYNICMIPISIGFLKPFNISMNPMLASIAMTISSLTVAFNALRLKKIK